MQQKIEQLEKEYPDLFGDQSSKNTLQRKAAAAAAVILNDSDDIKNDIDVIANTLRIWSQRRSS